MTEPNDVCGWCDVAHGGHQVDCPARERDEAQKECASAVKLLREVAQVIGCPCAGDIEPIRRNCGCLSSRIDFFLDDAEPCVGTPAKPRHVWPERINGGG